MMKRFPRLSAARAKPILAERVGLTPVELEERCRNLPDLQTEKYAATGLVKITASELEQIRTQLQETINDAGYPTANQVTRQSVDKALAAKLVSLNLPMGEMLRPDTWAWMCIHLLPGYVQWRWGKADGRVTEERFSGPVVRNALGRLWLRGRAFDRGPDSSDRWGLVNAIPEDATVAILERTTVASNHGLARAIAEKWIVTKVDGISAEKLLRDAMVRVRIKVVLTEPHSLDTTRLAEWVSTLL